MLALFKDQTSEIKRPDSKTWGRTQWRSFLDKGVLPSFEKLARAWAMEFPEIPCDLEDWAMKLNSRWMTENLLETREVFAHGPHLIEAIGDHRVDIPCILENEDWELWLEGLALELKLEFNFTHPCVSGHGSWFGQKFRVTLLHASVSDSGNSKAFFRVISKKEMPLDKFDLSPPQIEFFTEAIQNHENLLIAGATGSGKTSFLSSLLALASPEEHLIILEDTKEIVCSSQRLTRLISQKTPGRSLTDYLTHSLRLSPDRIVLGEMRSHEVVPYLLAMNTGHRGLMATLHASSAVDALFRVAQLFVLASGQKDMNQQEVLKLVTRNVRYVVFLEKRKVKEVIRVYGQDGESPLYDLVSF